MTSLTLLSTLSLAASVAPSALAPPHPLVMVSVLAAAQPPEKEFDVWLVRIQYCHRLARAPEIDKQIAELQARRDAAATPAEKRAIERQITKLEDDSDRQRPHAIYGWSMKADDAGKPIDSTRSMTGFILAATAENDRVIAAVRKAYERGDPAVIAIQREGAADLFTFDGRRWHRANRAAALSKPITMPEPGAFRIPPSTPMTDEQRRTVDVSLMHQRSEATDTGGTLHRYWMTIKSDQPPPSASRLRVWVAAHVEVDGARIGPIIQHIEVPKSPKGRFQQSQSFEFIARNGAKMNANATTAEPLAITWE